MSIIGIIVSIGATMIVSAIIAGVLAGFKNRDVSFWVAWSFLFPPMAVVLAFMPRVTGRRPRRTTLDEEDTMMDKV
ncbi:MAG: hypothetical protein ACR2OV_12495 [Hyphomicrobiaceae bacterium]